MTGVISAVIRTTRFGTAKAARGPAMDFSMAVIAFPAPCRALGPRSRSRSTGSAHTNSRRSMHADL